MLLEEIVIGSVKKDFLALLDGIEEKDRDYLYGCALVTDKDFASIHLIANTVNRHERKSDKTEINYDWNTDNWKYSTKHLKKRELDDVSYKLIALVMEEKEGLKGVTSPMFTRSLKRLKKELEKKGVNTKDVCFFVTVHDKDREEKKTEIESAKKINKGFMLENFLENR